MLTRTLNRMHMSRSLTPLKRFCTTVNRAAWTALLSLFTLTHLLPAQDQNISFNTTAAGTSKSITNWGLDVTWANPDNMRRGLAFMGTNEVDMVRVAFLANAPLTNADISVAQK